MDTLPYELVQFIINTLLPRDQCRFALTSHYYYDLTYSPLLQWHAKKRAIEIPRYIQTTYAIEEYSIRLCNNKVVIYDRYSDVFSNMTTGGYTCMSIDYDIFDHICSIKRYVIIHYVILCRLRKYLLSYINADVLRNKNPLYNLMDTPNMYSHLARYLSKRDEKKLDKAIYKF